MNRATIIILLILVLGGGYYLYSSNSNDGAIQSEGEDEREVMEEEVMVEGESMEMEESGVAGDVMESGEAMEDKVMEEKAMNGEAMEEPGGAVAMAGNYEDYSADKVARAENGDVVLFFHASWCPSCRGLNANIEENIASIPDGVSILKTDYDKETELKKKYGVTTQHTMVQIDKNGNLVKKWSGSSSLAKLLAEIS